jgi:hypothetical protein
MVASFTSIAWSRDADGILGTHTLGYLEPDRYRRRSIRKASSAVSSLGITDRNTNPSKGSAYGSGIHVKGSAHDRK